MGNGIHSQLKSLLRQMPKDERRQKLGDFLRQLGIQRQHSKPHGPHQNSSTHTTTTAPTANSPAQWAEIQTAQATANREIQTLERYDDRNSGGSSFNTVF